MRKSDRQQCLQYHQMNPSVTEFESKLIPTKGNILSDLQELMEEDISKITNETVMQHLPKNIYRYTV